MFLQWFIYFGLQHVICDRLFSNPDFCASRTMGRDSGWYASKDARRLDHAIGGQLSSFYTSAYTIGFDFVNPYSSGTDHSSGVVMLRCEDLPLDQRPLRKFHPVLMLIPGPIQPLSMDPYFKVIADDFVRYGPDSPHGMEVVPTTRCPNGQLAPARQFGHKVVLCGMAADTPAKSKAGNFMKSASATLGTFIR